METARSVLLFCYGNPSRMDDGLGPSFARAAEVWNQPGVDVDADYQLSLEDAVEVARYERVVFIDASVSGPEPFQFRQIDAGGQLPFTSHHVEPEFLMALARDLFQARTRAYLLAIRGYEFDDFGECLSPGASANLAAALEFMRRMLVAEDWDRVLFNQPASEARPC
jgi:hydrogenase maturation protease